MPAIDSASTDPASVNEAPGSAENGRMVGGPAFTVFLSGVMQGSNVESVLHAQDYRQHLREIISAAHPEAEVVCPAELNPDSVAYDDGAARRAFMDELDLAARCDVLVAFAPVATMGTAVEMYKAHEAGRLVFTVSPMASNWAVRFLSDRVFGDFAEFETFVFSGELGRAVSASLAVTERTPG